MSISTITYCKSREECSRAITEHGGICLFEAGQWLAIHSDIEAEKYRSSEYLWSLEKYDWIEPAQEEQQQALF